MNTGVQAAQALRQAFETQQDPKRIFIGFDGFTDTIIKVVQKRLSPEQYVPVDTIAQFGERISAAAGKSANIELMPLETRLGGNAPLLARALLQGDHHLTFAGTIGQPNQIEPLFSTFAESCNQVYPLGASGKTDALEFNDGKLFFGQMNAVSTLTYDQLTQQISEEQLTTLLDNLDLLATVNWTMIPHMTAIWKTIASSLLPRLNSKRPRWFLVDLADPAKRGAADLVDAMQVLQTFYPHFQVVLSLNFSEAQQLSQALLGSSPNNEQKESVLHLAEQLHTQTKLSRIVIHARTFAASTSQEGTFAIDGPHVAKPLTTTGGGDHFNAGYCHGLLFQLTPLQCLAVGVASSGFYVQHAKTPSIGDLCELLTRSI